MVVGARAWVRSIIEVRLEGGGRFGIGTWLEIEWEQLPGVLAAWEDPEAYPRLVVEGWLGNGLPYWGREKTLGLPARATVPNPGELPQITGSSDMFLQQILDEEWPHAALFDAFGTR